MTETAERAAPATGGGSGMGKATCLLATENASCVTVQVLPRDCRHAEVMPIFRP
jgi:hypothetical protein